MLAKADVQALILFDIDGTLVRRAGPHHSNALKKAIHNITGLDATIDHIPLHGMLDSDIITLMMRNAGAPEALIRQAMPEIILKAQALYVRGCPDIRRKVCPGVRRALARLERSGAVLGLVTGNLTRIGWKKLECAGLRQFFRFGAFGEMSANRAGLVRLAICHARKEGWAGPQTPVAMIGDAPADVCAAKANGVRSVAVLTGVSSRGELEALKPDLLLDDLRALRPEMLL